MNYPTRRQFRTNWGYQRELRKWRGLERGGGRKVEKKKEGRGEGKRG